MGRKYIFIFTNHFGIVISTFVFQRIKTGEKSPKLFHVANSRSKTPLASIRLQSEVLADSLEKTLPNSKEINFAERLIEDTQNLETQMDKIIQLSKNNTRWEVAPKALVVKEVIKNMVKNYAGDLEIEVTGLTEEKVLADQFALELILKNLMENTKHHSENKSAQITLNTSSRSIEVIYTDSGKFSGDSKKLGKLFYTNHSTRGSGIGLYLCSKLLMAMKSSINILAEGNFKVSFKLKKVA